MTWRIEAFLKDGWVTVHGHGCRTIEEANEYVQILGPGLRVVQC